MGIPEFLSLLVGVLGSSDAGLVDLLQNMMGSYSVRTYGILAICSPIGKALGDGLKVWLILTLRGKSHCWHRF